MELVRNEKFLYLVIASYESEERTSVAIPYCQECANAWWAYRVWLPSVLTSGALGLVVLYLVAVSLYVAAAVVAVALVAASLVARSAGRSFLRRPGGGVEDWSLFRYFDQPQIVALRQAGWREK